MSLRPIELSSSIQQTELKQRHQRRPKRRLVNSTLIPFCSSLILLSSTPSVIASRKTRKTEEFQCPDNHSGWASSPDCKSYFWCNNGVLSSQPYTCVEGSLFDSEQLICITAQWSNCNGIQTNSNNVNPKTSSNETSEVAEDVISTSPTSAISTLSEDSLLFSATPTSVLPTLLPSSNSPTITPTFRPTSLGPPIYFVDFPTQTCVTEGAASWVTDDDKFSTKAECCTVMLNWIPLEQCLGLNFIETNIIKAPTMSPSSSPTDRPTNLPSEFPSAMPTGIPSEYPSTWPTSVPSEMPSAWPTNRNPTFTPSLSPSKSPSQAPIPPPSMQPTLPPTEFISLVPTFNPTINQETLKQIELAAESKIQNHFLVELIGWANEGLDSVSMETLSSNSNQYYSSVLVTQRPTSPPTVSVLDITSDFSELMLPVVADATISEQRPNVNFGSHQALAVDGGNMKAREGDTIGEKFDTLLKFDISMVDHSRVLKNATIRLYAIADCLSGGTFHITTDSSWTTDEVTWDSAPAVDGLWVSRLPRIRSRQWYDVDLTSALLLRGTETAFSEANYLSIRIESEVNSRCLYSSMESSESPRMIIRYLDQPIIARDTELESTGKDEIPVIPEAPTALPPAKGDFFLLRATDDATIVGTNTFSNFGKEPNLLVAFDSLTRSIYDVLIRFDLSETHLTPPRSAVLSLFVETDCASAGYVTTTAVNDEWNEDEVTWSSAPIYDSHEHSGVGGTSVGVFGSVPANSWYGFNVLRALDDAIKARRNALTFRLSSGNLNPCQYTSINGGRAPKLLISF